MATHFQLCRQQQKAFKTYDRARNYHLHSAQEIVNCIVSISNNESWGEVLSNRSEKSAGDI
jgi:predicted ATP-binding protein involved in virulence